MHNKNIFSTPERNMKAILTSIILLVAFSTSAHALTYEYEVGAGTFGGGHGYKYDSIKTTYNDQTNILNWEVAHSGTVIPKNFWLVISDGENPKYNVNEYAIFYGSYDNSILSAYEYNGQNNEKSYQSLPFIGDFSAGLTENGNKLGFSIDVTGIKAFNSSAEWDGAVFAEKIGIWFHPFFGEMETDQDGKITLLDIKKQGWYDVGHKYTTVVPVPAAVWLFGSALAGFAGISRRKAKA